MAHGMIVPQFWHHTRLRALSATSRLVAAFLLTGRPAVDVPGLVPMGPGALSEELGFAPEEILRSLKELVQVEFIEVDFDARLIRVPNAPRYHRPNGNVVRAWWNRWRTLPESRLKSAHVESLRAAASPVDGGQGDVSRAWENTFGSIEMETIPEPFPNGYPNGSPNHSRMVGVSNSVSAASLSFSPEASSPARESSSIPSPEPDDDPKRKRHPDFRRFTDAFNALFGEANDGAKPDWPVAKRQAVDRLLKAHGLDECVRRATNMFHDPPPWPPPPYDIASLTAQFDRFAQPHSARASPRSRDLGFDGLGALALEFEKRGM